jgi:hypothetical protein
MSGLNWRSRSSGRGLAELPAVPADPGPALLRASGRYEGTAFASGKQRHVTQAGLGKRATADATLHASGLVLHRQGAAGTIFIPSPGWVQARLATELGGKKLDPDGVLVLRWRLGEAELDTAFRADDTAIYPEWVGTINGEVTRS